jgi:transcriptional regulator with PAS, ATPase and Fis domain
MHDILALCHEVASLRSTVLIQGESGTDGLPSPAEIIHKQWKTTKSPDYTESLYS